MKKWLMFFAVAAMVACENEKSTDTVDSNDNLTINQVDGENNENDDPKLDQNNTENEANETADNVTYNINDVDQRPVFGEGCTEATDAWKCTVDAVQDFITENIVYPKSAKRKGGESLEQVTFVVKADGTLGDKKFVTSDGYNCDGCQLAAVTAVAKMDNWKPAYKNGQPVDVELTLPVRFAIF